MLSVSIEVYGIINRKRVIVRHIGTARNEQEKTDLLTLAHNFIDGRVINKITDKEVRLRVNLNDKINEILRKLNLLT